MNTAVSIFELGPPAPNFKMAPRRKSVGTLRGSLNGILDRENNYLRSLSDYQARVRRRESIRNCKTTVVSELSKLRERFHLLPVACLVTSLDRDFM